MLINIIGRIFYKSSTFTTLCNVVRMYRSSESMLVGRTPASNTTGEQLLVVVVDINDVVNTTKYFVYRENPDVVDVVPQSHLLR